MKVVGEEALSELVEKIKQKSIQITPDDIEMIGDLMTSIQDLYLFWKKLRILTIMLQNGEFYQHPPICLK